MSSRTFFHRYISPIGPLVLVSDGAVLIGLHLPQGRDGRSPGSDWIDDAAPFRDVSSQLDRYFADELSTFDVPMRLHGTSFQQSVWSELAKIPHGTTISYLELATRIGNVRAVRAVGAANGRNPVPIIVPCHRVVGADGSLVGFGGGLDCKQWLLRHERALAPRGARRIENYGSWTARAEAATR